MSAMPDLLSAPDYQVARFLLERGIGALYLIAFVVAIQQFPALSGERGLEPAPRFLELVTFRQAPSIFHWRYSDRLVVAVDFEKSIVWIKWLGTHRDYDRLDVKEVEHERP